MTSVQTRSSSFVSKTNVSLISVTNCMPLAVIHLNVKVVTYHIRFPLYETKIVPLKSVMNLMLLAVAQCNFLRFVIMYRNCALLNNIIEV